jgi:hypothetical protein
MEINVGVPERIGRAALALAILGLALKKQGKPAVVAAFLAGDLMGSAISGLCPLYKLINLSTAGKSV